MSHTARRVSRAAACFGLTAAGVLSSLGGTASAAAPTVPVDRGYFLVKARHSSMCLDVAHASQRHAAPVVQARCSGGHNQQWRLIPQGDGLRFKIQARHSNMCLDVAHASRRHAAPVVQANCSGGSNQVWWFAPAQGRAPLVNSSIGRVPHIDNSAAIVADHTGMVLDVAHASRAHAAPVVQATLGAGREPGLNQLWRFERPPAG
ncbi:MULTISPECIES: RICIN domain-containing protein [unclassified Streptomyces]|uniref:RICIN domain-containing protein n=1 Tax=unclassified Streptomyces TaxID=2593676 RepID=UPI0037FF6EDD